MTPPRDEGPSTLAVRDPKKRCDEDFRALRAILHDLEPSKTRVDVRRGGEQDKGAGGQDEK